MVMNDNYDIEANCHNDTGILLKIGYMYLVLSESEAMKIVEEVLSCLEQMQSLKAEASKE